MFFRKKLLSPVDDTRLIKAIQLAELQTSGEIRVHIEKQLKGDVITATKNKFAELNMHQTKDRNGILFYLAIDSKSFAVWGDEGIHQKVGNSFWKEEAVILKNHLQNDAITEGVCEVVTSIGLKLKDLFPDDTEGSNQLSDKPVYGK